MQLSTAQFHDLYMKSNDSLRKVQLINGVVRMLSQVRLGVHGRQNNIMSGLMFVYSARAAGVEPTVSATLKLSTRNEV